MTAADAPNGPLRATTAALRVAAFHGGPVDSGLLAAGAAGSPQDRWLAAVVHGACGRYAAACALLEPLARGTLAAEGAGPVLGSLACSTLASHRRQVGGHAAARRWDAAALRRLGPAWGRLGPPDPDGVDAAGAASDALLGLAADALGVGRLSESRRLIARAAAVRGPAPGWRARVRQQWVTAELALAAGEPVAARAPAESALQLSEQQGATRHVVKSQIVLAVALITARDDHDRARRLLSAAIETASKFGWHSLTWPAAFAGAEFDHDLQDYGSGVLYGVLQRSDPEARELAYRSPWVPEPVPPADADIRGKIPEKKATRSCQGSAESVR